MMDNDFHIAVVYQEPIISPVVIAGFKEDIQFPGLKAVVEPIPMMGVRAALEWLMPTAIVAYIAKPYFESFLGEMGKDHYALTKNALAKLRARVVARLGDHLEVVATKGKLRPDSNVFSPIFSVEAHTPYGYRIKLLIQSNLEVAAFDSALDALFRFMAEINGCEPLREHSNSLLANRPSGTVLLVCFNPEIGQLEYVNPISPREMTKS